MTSNIDRLAEIIAQNRALPPQEVAAAINAEGMLLPDLPKPDKPEDGKWDAEEDIDVFDLSKISLLGGGEVMPGWVALAISREDGVIVQAMPEASMKHIGLCLIAASADSAAAAADEELRDV